MCNNKHYIAFVLLVSVENNMKYDRRPLETYPIKYSHIFRKETKIRIFSFALQFISRSNTALGDRVMKIKIKKKEVKGIFLYNFVICANL